MGTGWNVEDVCEALMVEEETLEVRKVAKEMGIELIFLPPYSPNLNLIERLWKFFRKKVLYNRYYEKFNDFKIACEDFFKNIRKYKNELQSLLTENFQILDVNP